MPVAGRGDPDLANGAALAPQGRADGTRTRRPPLGVERDAGVGTSSAPPGPRHRHAFPLIGRYPVNGRYSVATIAHDHPPSFLSWPARERPRDGDIRWSERRGTRAWRRRPRIRARDRCRRAPVPPGGLHPRAVPTTSGPTRSLPPLPHRHPRPCLCHVARPLDMPMLTTDNAMVSEARTATRRRGLA